MKKIQSVEGGRIGNEQTKRKNENKERKEKRKIINLNRKTESVDENREKI